MQERRREVAEGLLAERAVLSETVQFLELLERVDRLRVEREVRGGHCTVCGKIAECHKQAAQLWRTQVGLAGFDGAAAERRQVGQAGFKRKQPEFRQRGLQQLVVFVWRFDPRKDGFGIRGRRGLFQYAQPVDAIRRDGDVEAGRLRIDPAVVQMRRESQHGGRQGQIELRPLVRVGARCRDEVDQVVENLIRFIVAAVQAVVFGSAQHGQDGEGRSGRRLVLGPQRPPAVLFIELPQGFPLAPEVRRGDVRVFACEQHLFEGRPERLGVTRLRSCRGRQQRETDRAQVPGPQS